MASPFHDLSVADDRDLIRLLNRAQLVRDDKVGASAFSQRAPSRDCRMCVPVTYICSITLVYHIIAHMAIEFIAGLQLREEGCPGRSLQVAGVKFYLLELSSGNAFRAIPPGVLQRIMPQIQLEVI